jgi:hypothetical protein
VAIDKRLFLVTKKGTGRTAYRSKIQKGNNYDEKRGAVGFRGNSQAGANCQENDFVAIDCGTSRVTKKQTDFRDNRLSLKKTQQFLANCSTRHKKTGQWDF